MNHSNPLLNIRDLIAYDAIRPEHVAPAVQTLLEDANRALETVCAPDFATSWRELSTVLDVATDRLSVTWGAVSHLNSVADTPELRAAYNETLPKITEFFTRLGADERLYAKFKAMDRASLDAEQGQAHHNALRDFVLGGAELADAARARYAAIQERQAELSQTFSEHTLDATDAYAYYADASEIKGLPSDVQQAAQEAANADNKQGYKLTLKMPCYLPVMQFADSADLRARLYRAYVTRASDQADADMQKFDNAPLIQEILTLRLEEARLLGYPQYAALSVVPKMADAPEQVIAFLRDLGARARPFAEQDLRDLQAFATEHGYLPAGQAALHAWDVPYVSEKLKEARYAFSEMEVKQYFTAPKVLAGLFKIVENLFEVQLRPDQAPVWHKDVSFYRIERAGELLGQFYLDASARTGKRGGAWMDGARSRWLRPDTGKLQTPIAHLVCNFAEGVDGRPALLTHDDVTTLFHEFGHGLHHLLTQVNESAVSGISGVEWDAVELPSQFMENFCWEWRVIADMTSHVDTGEPLPRSLFDKMLAAKNFQSGMQTLRQIEFALFDMLLHSTHDPAQDFMPLLDAVRQEVAVLHPPSWSRTPHTFGHIFAGGYAAGYYSYKWAEVLSADAYGAFEESVGADGLPNQLTGRKYRQAILERGGSRPALASFVDFRGREPSIDALLHHLGMAGPVQVL